MTAGKTAAEGLGVLCEEVGELGTSADRQMSGKGGTTLVENAF